MLTQPLAQLLLTARGAQGGGKTAALFINGGSTNYTASVRMRDLNVSTSGVVKATDVWTGEDAGPVVDGEWKTGLVAVLDSRFVVFQA